MLTESNLRVACGLRRRQSFCALGMARAVPDSPADVSDEGVPISGQYSFPKVPRRSYQSGHFAEEPKAPELQDAILVVDVSASKPLTTQSLCLGALVP